MNAIPDWNREESAPQRRDGGGEVLMRAAEMIRGDFEQRTWQAFRLSTAENLPAPRRDLIAFEYDGKCNSTGSVPSDSETS
jgi:hypothetical protein